jgi:hypothetical protein
VYFIAGEENKAEKRINNPRFRTKLTGYFDLCRDDPNARKYKYAEIERDYTWHVVQYGEYVWKFEPRLRPPRGGQHIGYIYPPNRKKSELYALYLLLNELYGVQSYDDARTLNRPSDPDYDPSQPPVMCRSFVEACIKRGLLSDCDRWIAVMEQIAIVIHNPYQLIRHFVTMLLHSRPEEPRRMFDHFLERLLPPAQRHRRNDYEIRYQSLLRQIQRQLSKVGRQMKDYDLPEPEPDQRSDEERINDELFEPEIDPQTET